MNKVILIGYVCKDIELNTTATGVNVARFNLAVQRKYGEKETDFLSVVVWRNIAENCSKFLKKGSKCAVTGEIQNREYTDNDGKKRYTTEIIANEVEFLDSKKDDGGIELKPEQPPQSNLQPIQDDNLPF